MARKTTIIAGTFFAAALAAGGAAFTAGNTAPATDTLGYSSTTVSGAVVNSMAYNLNAAGSNVDSVTLVLDTDTTALSVKLAFNSGSAVSCGTGTYDATATETTYTCNNGGSAYVQPTSGVTSTNIVVQ